ncbi:MAG: hypothetical protein IPK82_33425 [Polyangiaceae bacterium]|nr:hypothetical protein [Polyangiaceae bacterium]
MKRLIFLDIDGVLNSAQFIAENTNGEGVIIVDGAFDATSHIDPLRVERLNRLIAATHAEVVLSSSWRRLFGVEKTQFSLKAKGFAYEIADSTVRMPGHPRQAEIESYLSSFTVRPPFVILDDATEAGIGFGKNFIHIHDGLEEEHIEQARRILLNSETLGEHLA